MGERRREGGGWAKEGGGWVKEGGREGVGQRMSKEVGS